MKQLILLASLFIILESTQAQDSLRSMQPNVWLKKTQPSLPQKYSKEYFQEKASSLNTTAWVLLGAGAVVGGIGLSVYENSTRTSTWELLGASFGGEFLMAAGSALVVTSVPIFIRSGYYKNKAMNISATMNLEPCQSGLAMRSFPSVGLRIQF